MFYELARRYDEWPGVDYEGSCCRGALKGWNKHGVCAEALWPYRSARTARPSSSPPKAGWDIDAVTRPLGVYYRVDKASVVDMQAALNDIGAIYVSADVHDGWDASSRRRTSGCPRRTRRCRSSRRITESEDARRARVRARRLQRAIGFVVQNSWGELWGARGFAVLPYDDWVDHGTDAWVCALGVPVAVSDERLALSRFRVSAGQALGMQSTHAAESGEPQRRSVADRPPVRLRALPAVEHGRGVRAHAGERQRRRADALGRGVRRRRRSGAVRDESRARRAACLVRPAAGPRAGEADGLRARWAQQRRRVDPPHSRSRPVRRSERHLSVVHDMADGTGRIADRCLHRLLQGPAGNRAGTGRRLRG